MTTWWRLAGTLACAFAAAGLASAQTAPPPSTAEAPAEVFAPGTGGTMVHRASGFAFPEMLGDMPRRKFRVYAADDVDASYTRKGGANGDPWLNVYVYPAPRSVAEEAEIVEHELVRNLGGKPLEAQPPLPAGADGVVSRWFEGSYQGHVLTSGYVLAKRGRWYLLARGSSPKEAGSAGMARLQAAIAALDWRWAPKL